MYVAICSSPSDPPNGEVTYNGTSLGDNATYSCNSGFELVGDAQATCTVNENNASFMPLPPICNRKLHPKNTEYRYAKIWSYP